MDERIQKILARAGYGSRRSCETLISDGRVTCNGQVATLGAKADTARDQIRVDGRLIAAPEPLTYVLLYKPRGVLSAVEAPDPRPTVRELVPIQGTLYPVGRLDVDSEGLLLLTNDGELANRLTHPKFGHEKEYRVLIARRPDEAQLEAFRRGVVLEDGYRTMPAEVRVESYFGKGTWLRVILSEGRKRQIRETCSQIGLPVVRIVRIRMGSLSLGRLKAREWRHLTGAEIEILKGEASGKVKPAARRAAHPGVGERPNRPQAKPRPAKRAAPDSPRKSSRPPTSSRGKKGPQR